MKLLSAKSQKNLRKKLRSGATPQEVRLWARLRRSQLGVKFRRQQSIGKYIVDFYCPEKGLIIELDGSGHKTDEGVEYDQIRTGFLYAKNFVVLRFDNTDIDKNMPGVIQKIEETLKATTL